MNLKKICVTLKETPEEMLRAQSHFDQIGLSDVSMWYGINGQVAGLHTKHPYALDNHDTTVGFHSCGIYTTWRGIWSAILVGDHTHWLVMEQDVVFNPGWRERMDQALRDAPKDFDVLLLGSCTTLDKPRKHVAGEVWDLRYPFCGHASVISKAGASRMIELCQKCWAPLDVQLIVEAFPRMKVFTVLPRLCSQFNKPNLPE